jgi:hypothetical protein
MVSLAATVVEEELAPSIDALNFARAIVPASKAERDAARMAGLTPSSLLPSIGGFTLFVVDTIPLLLTTLRVEDVTFIGTGGEYLLASCSICGSLGSNSRRRYCAADDSNAVRMLFRPTKTRRVVVAEVVDAAEALWN